MSIYVLVGLYTFLGQVSSINHLHENFLDGHRKRLEAITRIFPTTTTKVNQLKNQ